MRALVTGATGFIGRSLLNRLDQPVVLSRNARRAGRLLGPVRAFDWDPLAGPPPSEALAGIDAVINLAGEPLTGGRWTQARRAMIYDSRVKGTQNLVAGIQRQSVPPRVLVSASAVGYYGDRDGEVLDERSTPGSDFLAKVCRDWEQAAEGVRALGVRLVIARIGVVLGPRGGALAMMLLPFRLGLGGPLAGGRQWTPWIHLEDIVRLLLLGVENEKLDGPMNAVAPAPVTNREFTRTLAAVLHRPAFLPVPGMALRVMLGGFAEVLLASQRVMPRVAEEAGFEYRYPRLDRALEAAV